MGREYFTHECGCREYCDMGSVKIESYCSKHDPNGLEHLKQKKQKLDKKIEQLESKKWVYS